MKKRIIAAILSFILLMNSSVTALATEGESFSANEVTVSASVSENEIPEETEEISEESTEEGTIESTEEIEESGAEEETTTETETTTEAETVEETTVVTEAGTLEISGYEMVNGISVQSETVLREAKAALRELVDEKAIYALVYLTDSYAVKEAPSKEADTVATVPSAKTVQILDVEAEWNYNEKREEYIPTIWYYVQFYVGETLEKGYIEDGFLAYSDELLIAWQNDYPELFGTAASLLSSNAVYGASTSYADVEKFPSSYQVYLRKLKDAHPNWTFVPMNINMDWDDCVDEQMETDGTGDPFSMIWHTEPAKFRWTQISDTWYRASRTGVEYYMDPRNFLNETYVFQFEQNSFNQSYHSTDALDKYFKGSFMEGNVPDKLPDEVKKYGKTYSDVFYYVGKSRGISPFFLAAKVMLEQGRNGSDMVSGTYPGYENLYNFFNMGASGTGTTAIKNGLEYARGQGWTTRYKSIAGGAQSYGNGYILKGQDTLYLQKFDVEYLKNERKSLHQYMQNIKAPSQDGASVKSMYESSSALNSKFVFKIPVYNDMPTLGYIMTSKSSVSLEKNKTYQIGMKYNGTKISDLSIFTFKSADTSIATVSDTGKITAVGSGANYSGKTTITATLKEDSEVYFRINVTVICPLTNIELDAENIELFFMTDGLPDKIPYAENGVTKYYSKAECPTQTTLTVFYNPEDTTDARKVKWTIEDESIVSYEPLDENETQIRLIAKAGGSTTVTAQVGKCQASAKVNVRVPMTEAWLSENELILYKGQSAQVTADYFPYNTTDAVDLEWIVVEENAENPTGTEKEGEKVVKVVNGAFTAVGKGTVTLQATIGAFKGVGVENAIKTKLTVSVTVKEYSVTFMNEDGSILFEMPGTYGATLANISEYAGTDVEVPWELMKNGYVFAGWYTEKNGEGNPVTQDTVLYESMVLYPYFMSAETEFFVKPIGSVVYTGGYLKPAVTVYAGEKLLTKGLDYTVTYVNNRDVWNAESDADNMRPKVIIKGRGIYKDNAVEAKFVIVPKNVKDVDVMASNVIIAFDGKQHKIQPIIADAGRILQKDIDYTVNYPAETDNKGNVNDNAYLQPGTWLIQIVGKGNYVGTRTVYLTITKRTSISEVNIAAIKDVAYNDGEPFEPEKEAKVWEPKPVITYQKKTLAEGVDYELSYANNREIGTATVTVTGIGAFIGARSVDFRITGTDISTATISGIHNAEYTAERIVLDSVVVKNKKKQTLAPDKDYELLFENNKEVGKAYVTLIGKNGYTGTLKIPFYIEPYNITANAQTYEPDEGVTKPAFEVVSDEVVEYERSGAEPSVKAYFKGEELKEGTDYKVSYKNNHNTDETEDSSKPTIVITGKGRFTGTYEKTFSISKKDIADVTITANDVAFRNRKGFCFVEPVLKDTSGRRLKSGVDYSDEFAYTYAVDVVLYDGTIRLAGEEVQENDIPTEGELKDAEITVTVKGIGNYTGEVSATYRILENTSWFEDWFGNEEPKITVNRTKLYLNRLYPEYGDTIKMASSVGELLEEKTTFTCDNEGAEDYFNIVFEDGRLTIYLSGTREEMTGIAGDYTFTVSSVALIDGMEKSLSDRTLTVCVSEIPPVTDVEISGCIDLLYRDSTAVWADISMASDKDGFSLPASKAEMDGAYSISGDDAGLYEIIYENSTFASEAVRLCIRATEGNDEESYLTPGKSSNLTLQFRTQKGVRLTEDFSVTPQQTKCQIILKTKNCYIKMEEGSGQIIFTSSPADIEYQSVVCNDERIEVSVYNRSISVNVPDISEFEMGQELELTIYAYAKSAGKNVIAATAEVTLVFCDETELEQLIKSKDTSIKTLEERQEIMSSYAETKAVNALDKKIIASNTIDFSDVKIAFLGDSITEGAGLEKIGVEENVYCSVVKRALNVKEVYRLGIGGAGICRNGDCYSLYNYYHNIPKDTDIIFVQAGINDVYAGSEEEFGSLFNLYQKGTFCADTYALMSALQADYPEAQIVFLTPLPTITSTWYKEMLPQMLPVSRYAAAIKTIADKKELSNVEVWDLYNSNILDSYDDNVRSRYMYDGVHPGVEGHRVLGEYIASGLIRQKAGYTLYDTEQLPEQEYVIPQMYRESTDKDDTDSFNRAIKAAQGKTVYVPAGTYRINTGSGIKLRDDTNLIMSPDAKIKAIVSKEKQYKIFRLRSVDNVTISGGQIIGERYQHKGTEGEWGMGILLYDSTNVRISDVKISDCWGDGIYIGAEDDNIAGAGCDNVTIENCHLFNNRRNNLSVVCGKNITVNNCTFENANGTAPEFGIDIEPNYPDINPCRDITISNSKFINNKGGSLGIMKTANNVHVTSCEMDGMFLNYAGRDVDISDCRINGEMDAVIGVTVDDKTIFNDGTDAEDVLIAALNVDKEFYDFIEYRVNEDNPMSASVIDDSNSPSGKALSLKRLSQGTQESGYYLKLSEFDLEDGVEDALKPGETYRFEYVVKGTGAWGFKTNQTGWYPCIPIENEYRTCFTTYKAKAEDYCQVLLYATDMTKDIHIEVSSIKIYKVR